MQQLLKLMNQRANTLRQAIRRAEKDDGTFAEGWLRVSVDKGRPRYYQVTESGDTSGEYIKKQERSLARNLAQKDYNKIFIEMAGEELRMLENSIKQLTEESADIAYTGLNVHRRALITPYIYTDEKYAEEWLKMSYKTNPYKPEEKTRETNRGDKVRSKSEGFIANILSDLGIPYHYEQALKLKNGKTYYPDFTLLKKSTREIIYLEHLGLLDDDSYRKSVLAKIDDYRADGIYLGKNLLITYETASNPIDIGGIRNMLQAIFE